jgi:hypothetical protein
VKRQDKEFTNCYAEASVPDWDCSGHDSKCFPHPRGDGPGTTAERQQ